jgi:hypothetical protein
MGVDAIEPRWCSTVAGSTLVFRPACDSVLGQAVPSRVAGLGLLPVRTHSFAGGTADPSLSLVMTTLRRAFQGFL